MPPDEAELTRRLPLKLFPTTKSMGVKGDGFGPTGIVEKLLWLVDVGSTRLLRSAAWERAPSLPNAPFGNHVR